MNAQRMYDKRLDEMDREHAEMKALIKKYKPGIVAWGKSAEGYCTSICGRFKISPLWFGRVRAQRYRLHDENRNIRSDSCNTQRAAKAMAQTWADLKSPVEK